MTLIAGRFQPLETPRPPAPVRARDLQTAQSVVLYDVMLPATAEEARRRAEAAKGICHPSLITLFEVLPLGDRLLLAYEYVAAQTLAQMSGGQPLHPKRAVAIVSEIADAVAELHARGVAHGAISQSTVLVTMKGRAKLDRLADPSLAGDEAPTPAGDLVALGRVLREIVGGTGGGVLGMQAVEVIAGRALSGRFASAAAFAALLRMGVRP